MKFATILVILAIAAYAQCGLAAQGKVVLKKIIDTCITNTAKIPAAAKPLAHQAAAAVLGRRRLLATRRTGVKEVACNVLVTAACSHPNLAAACDCFKPQMVAQCVSYMS